MFEVLGKTYYIDVDELIEKCRPEYVEEKNEDGINEQKLELNVFKFEVFKTCMERVLVDYEDGDDDEIAALTNKTKSTSFGLSFNTLLKNKIIKEDE